MYVNSQHILYTDFLILCPVIMHVLKALDRQYQLSMLNGCTRFSSLRSFNVFVMLLCSWDGVFHPGMYFKRGFHCASFLLFLK